MLLVYHLPLDMSILLCYIDNNMNKDMLPHIDTSLLNEFDNTELDPDMLCDTSDEQDSIDDFEQGKLIDHTWDLLKYE